jgi:hypothetical protein
MREEYRPTYVSLQIPRGRRKVRQHRLTAAFRAACIHLGTRSMKGISYSSQEFFRLLAICHTVLPEGGETPDNIAHQSPSVCCLHLAGKPYSALSVWTQSHNPYRSSSACWPSATRSSPRGGKRQTASCTRPRPPTRRPSWWLPRTSASSSTSEPRPRFGCRSRTSRSWGASRTWSTRCSTCSSSTGQQKKENKKKKRESRCQEDIATSDSFVVALDLV